MMMAQHAATEETGVASIRNVMTVERRETNCSNLGTQSTECQGLVGSVAAWTPSNLAQRVARADEHSDAVEAGS